MYEFVLTIHIIVCVLIVFFVLIQHGKGAELGAVFGSSEAFFGPAGPATMIGKATTLLAVLFFITSLSLTYLNIHKKPTSVIQNIEIKKEETKEQIKPPETNTTTTK